MATKTLDQGYERALKAIEEKLGKERGAASWLACKLGISRQRLFLYRRSGFPQDYEAKVAKLSGLPEGFIKSDTIVIRVPRLTWDLLAPKELKDQSKIMRKL